jgi:hypothetical protein
VHLPADFDNRFVNGHTFMQPHEVGGHFGTARSFGKGAQTQNIPPRLGGQEIDNIFCRFGIHVLKDVHAVIRRQCTDQNDRFFARSGFKEFRLCVEVEITENI